MRRLNSYLLYQKGVEFSKTMLLKITKKFQQKIVSLKLFITENFRC